MSDQITWIIEGTIKSGQVENFKALATEMVAATQAEETKATIYQWFITEDNNRYHIYERYADSAGVLTHLQNFGQNFAERFFTLADVTNFPVFGQPNEEAKEALNGFGAVFMESIAGFTR